MNALSNKRMLIAYKGPFTIQVVSSLGEFIRAMPIDDSISRSRLFKSLIEVAQNISLYSAEKITFNNGDKSGFGMLKIEEDEQYFRITTKNKIEISNFDKLDVYCKQINDLNFKQLRELKSFNIRNKKEQDNSAHLGFIYITLLTYNKIEFHFDKKHSSFELTVKVDKQYTKNIKQ
jgi:hypothetical protein